MAIMDSTEAQLRFGASLTQSSDPQHPRHPLHSTTNSTNAIPPTTSSGIGSVKIAYFSIIFVLCLILIFRFK